MGRRWESRNGCQQSQQQQQQQPQQQQPQQQQPQQQQQQSTPNSYRYWTTTDPIDIISPSKSATTAKQWGNGYRKSL